MTQKPTQDVANRSRQPKGVSTGGQFATERRSEASGVSLALPANPRELGRAMPELDVDLDNDDSMKRMVEAVQMASRYWTEHYGVERRSNSFTADDLAQQTLVEIWRQYKAGKLNGQFPRKYVISVAANQAVRMTSDSKRFQAEDRRAMRLLQSKLEAIQVEHGRTPTREEYDRCKAEVLQEWHDPRHKPHEDFDITPSRAVSLDRPIGDDPSGATLGDLLEERGMDNYVEPGSRLDQTMQDLESRGAKAVDRRRRQAWNSIAELTGMPLTRPGALSADQVQTHVQAVSEYGGLKKALHDWEAGESTSAVDAALCAPFGDLTIREEAKVYTQLGKMARGMSEEQADDLFASMVESAGPDGADDEKFFRKEQAKIRAGEDSATRRARRATEEGEAA